MAGEIIDGRNRYLACKLAGVEPVFKGIDFPAARTEALAFVVSRNLKRRHLTTPQRSMVAAKVANMRKGERTDLEPSSNLSNVVSQGKAAEMLNVSRTSVQTAKAVLNRGGPELAAAVESGEVSLHQAAETVRAELETIKPKRQPPVRVLHAPVRDFRTCLHRFCNTRYYQNNEIGRARHQVAPNVARRTGERHRGAWRIVFRGVGCLLGDHRGPDDIVHLLSRQPRLGARNNAKPAHFRRASRYWTAWRVSTSLSRRRMS